MAKKVFKLSSGYFYLLFLQLIGMCVSAIYLFCQISILTFVLLKLCNYFLLTFLIADKFKISYLFSIFIFLVTSLFSVYGFFEFIKLYIKSVFFHEFDIKIGSYFDFLIMLSVLLYIFLIYSLTRYLTKNSEIKKHLVKVSLNLMNTNITFTGLIDSGNSLYDEKSGKPVVIVSVYSLMKYFPSFTPRVLISTLSTRQINYATISNDDSKIFVTSPKKIIVFQGNSQESYTAVIGFVDMKFENGKYDCLLNRDMF